MRWLMASALVLTASVAHAEAGLSQAEQTDFVAQVARCWNVSGLGEDALTPVVTVRFSLKRDGKPVGDSLELIGAGKDTSDAVKLAYDAARRAILRCGGRGYKLPLEKYDEWRNIELTFNPERMSLR